MKRLNILYSLFAGFLIVSCTEFETLEYVVNKPVSIELQEQIDAYDVLRSYASDGFQIGAGLPMSTYLDAGVPFRLVNSNFTEVTLSSGMYHGNIVQDGGIVNAEGIVDLANVTKEAGISLYGSALVWHQNQNGEFLNSTIAPIVIPAQGGPQWLKVTENDFETDDVANIVTNDGAERSYTADGEGANGEGRALKITNSQVRENDWESQLFLVWDTPTEVGERYRLTMDIRADEAATFPTQAQIVAFQYKHWDFFGQFSATTEWTNLVVEVTIDENTSGCAALAFNLGSKATSYYFDNIVLEKFNEDGGGPTWDLLSGNDFETDDVANIVTNDGAERSYTSDGEGANGQGRALTVTNSSVRDNDWESQLFFTFQPASVVGERLQLTMDIKADQEASFSTQAQFAPYEYKHWNFFGSFTATTEWQSVNVQITVDENTSECTAIAFNLGNTATTYYFDNIEVRWYNEEGAGETIIERTPEEKKDTLTYHLEQYVAGMMQAAQENVTAWEVIKDPMDDADPTELRSGGDGELPENVFYWQDYLGMDYGPIAFNLARKYAKDGDLLFISESGLASNLEKCQGLIDYIEYIEAEGATVDGVAVQMNLGLPADQPMIEEMFKLLGETGKMIKISELNVALPSEPTMEMLESQADLYKYVLDTFAAQIPAGKRYGVTVWNPSDQPSLWQGLWYSDYTRKPAYASFADGLESMN